MMPNTKKDNIELKPWYKEPWPWLLWLGPGVVVIASIITYVIADKTADAMVEDDYYKHGKEINLQLQRDKNAYAQHITAEAMISSDMKSIRVMLKNPPQTEDQLIFRALHPTLPARDQSVLLHKLAPNFFQAQVDLTDTSHWYIRIEDKKQTWRIQGEWIPADGSSVTLDSMLPGTDQQ